MNKKVTFFPIVADKKKLLRTEANPKLFNTINRQTPSKKFLTPPYDKLPYCNFFCKTWKFSGCKSYWGQGGFFSIFSKGK